MFTLKFDNGSAAYDKFIGHFLRQEPIKVKLGDFEAGSVIIREVKRSSFGLSEFVFYQIQDRPIPVIHLNKTDS